MITTLDEKGEVRLLPMFGTDNLYLISILRDSKLLIETKYCGNDILIKTDVQNSCTVEELTRILYLFSQYIYSKNPEVNGILLRADDDPMLESIGFKAMSENSEYLYQKNTQNQKGKGEQK